MGVRVTGVVEAMDRYEQLYRSGEFPDAAEQAKRIAETLEREGHENAAFWWKAAEDCEAYGRG